MTSISMIEPVVNDYVQLLLPLVRQTQIQLVDLLVDLLLQYVYIYIYMRCNVTVSNIDV